MSCDEACLNGASPKQCVEQALLSQVSHGHDCDCDTYLKANGPAGALGPHVAALLVSHLHGHRACFLRAAAFYL